MSIGKIKQLDNRLANQIAAGEVVERPASVVKELLENALDAGATVITIDVDEGGVKRIRITDNGTGIAADELPLALARHATSKIASIDDLEAVATLGFRGEALASIASFSRLSLCSRLKGSQSGLKVDLDGGKGDLAGIAWQGPAGTTISVSDLFFNVPARGKFLKTTTTEYSHCFDLIQSVALSRPDVEINLLHNGKEKLNVNALKVEKINIDRNILGEVVLRQRTKAILGKDLTDDLLYVLEQNDFGCFEGLVSPPGLEKPTSRQILTFVNKRWVKDNVIRYGIMRGYQSHLLKGKYPVAVVHFNCDPSLIDCNVHPAKTELRFQYSGEVQGLLALGVRKAIRSCDWVQDKDSKNQTDEETKDLGVEKDSQSVTRVKSDSEETTKITRNFLSNSPNRFLSKESRATTTSSRIQFEPRKNVLFDANITNKNEATTKNFSKSENILEPIPWDEVRYVGNFAKCYLMFEKKNQLLMVDQHAFHERILFEKLNRDKSLLSQSQSLIIPEIVELSTAAAEYLLEEKDKLKEAGFDYTLVERNTFEINAIPSILTGKCLDSLFVSLTNPQNQTNSGELMTNHLSHHTLSTMACHAAVRAGEDLNLEDINLLIKEASEVDFYHNCPHGRRVFKWFSKRQVESWFDR